MNLKHLSPPEPGPHHPQPPSPRTFQALRDLLQSKTGIFLSPSKVSMVQARLNKRLRALGLQDFDDYLGILRDQPEGEEWIHFVNAMTTNITSFFRESHHFEALVAQLTEHPPAQSRIRIWSAGCSTGEEPYTIAMTLRAAFPDSTIRILATDLDSEVLRHARRGVYPSERLEDLPAGWRAFGFLKGKGPMDGKVRIRPEIQQLVTFRPMNFLQDPWPAARSFEAIFCRNTMIYFDKTIQAQLVARFRECLEPGGLFLVGHSETLHGVNAGLTSIGSTMYLRQEAVP